jgi:hypothetical protein
MERAHVRTRQPLNLQRGFERSRLEDQLVATAYEWALPVRRQALPTTSRLPTAKIAKDQPSTAIGGLSA